MNQNSWIIGGGVLIIAFTIMLFMISDKSSKPTEIPVSVSTTTGQGDTAPVTEIPTTKTTPVTDADVSAKSLPIAAPSVTPPQSGLVVLHTTMGDITIKLYTKDAPNASEKFIKLAREGFYDGVRFHRVIKNFMIQSGDPLSKDDAKMSAWGTGGPGYAFANETNSHLFVRGSLGMANSGGTESNGSQFFIVTAQATPFLNGGYTNFGEVVSGLDVAMKIQDVETDGSASAGTGHDRPLVPVTITKVEVK